MARVPGFSQFLYYFIYLSIITFCLFGVVGANRELDEDNWKDILEGEWMVKFYAPWCPACNALAPTWHELSTRAARKTLGVKAAGVDVTKSPGLSGRFVVTALPTVFHVIDGEFRLYKGPRDVDSLLGYIEEQRWKETDPIPGWKAPDSIQMTLVAEFFKLSQVLRSVHNTLMEEYGLPTWGSYLIFAVATILIGALLGLLLVCIIDLLYPPRLPGKVPVSMAERDRAMGDQENKSDDDQALINDDIVDDAEEDDSSDAEKHSQSDTSEDEKEAPTAEGGDAKAEDEKPGEVRKRRPRKVD